MTELPLYFPECDARKQDMHPDGIGGCFESFSCSIQRYGDISCGSLLSKNKCPKGKKFLKPEEYVFVCPCLKKHLLVKYYGPGKAFMEENKQ